MLQRQPHLVMHDERQFRLAGGGFVLALHGALLALAIWHFGAKTLHLPPTPLMEVVLSRTPPPPPSVTRFKPLKLEVMTSLVVPPPDILIAADPQPPQQEGRVVPPPPPPVAAAPPAPAPPPGPAPDLNGYLTRVAARIQQFLQMPGQMQGTALVHLRFGSDGKVTLAEIAQTSGNVALDREALAVMWRAQPMPPIPPELKLDHLNGVVPVRFTLARH